MLFKNEESIDKWSLDNVLISSSDVTSLIKHIVTTDEFFSETMKRINDVDRLVLAIIKNMMRMHMLSDNCKTVIYEKVIITTVGIRVSRRMTAQTNNKCYTQMVEKAYFPIDELITTLELKASSNKWKNSYYRHTLSKDERIQLYFKLADLLKTDKIKNLLSLDKIATDLD